MKKQLVIGLLLSILTTVSIMANTYYVRSYLVHTLKSPKIGANRIETLKRGTKVTVLSKDGAWFKIKATNNAGWVSQLSLSKKKPSNRVSLLASEVELSKTARKRASTYTSTAAARGLSESASKRISGQVVPNFEAVKKMETWQKSDEVSINYLMEGDENK